MGLEIERKFLVKDDSWRKGIHGVRYVQGYLCTDKERVVRVRTGHGRGIIGVKGPARGIARLEYEYEIPLEDAREILNSLCKKPLIEKTRYRIPYEGLVWEVDEFTGANDGLVVAEVELEREDQEVPLPAWVGKEVTHDSRYTNAALVDRPYTRWG
ncbi:MAG: CYTH domain-containing protein [Deltaproteobacteria bacterium]|nr:CYTH domain-containing protein [Deltaproteobacteria bacterium]MBW2007852.1 CYTH domain-containing protein [Deltaproteobacteria bacterium]